MFISKGDKTPGHIPITFSYIHIYMCENSVSLPDQSAINYCVIYEYIYIYIYVWMNIMCVWSVSAKTLVFKVQNVSIYSCKNIIHIDIYIYL